MPYYDNKTPKDKQQSASNKIAKKQSNKQAVYSIVDKRSESIVQQKLQDKIKNSLQLKQLTAYHEMANAESKTQIPPQIPSKLETIQAQFINSSSNNVIQLEGGKDGEEKDQKEKSKKADTSLGTQVLKQGSTTGFLEKTGTALTSIAEKVSTTPALEHVGQSATGAAIVGDLGGMFSGGLQIHSGAKGSHLSTGERAKEITTGAISTTANTAKTGLDAAQVITHATALAPPAALLGAAVGGVEAVKGGIDFHAANKLKKGLEGTSEKTKESMGLITFSTLEIGAHEKRKQAKVGGVLGGSKLVAGAVLAAVGFAHLGPIGMAVSAAILAGLGIGSLGKFAKQRFNQKKLGMTLVEEKYHATAIKHQHWQFELNRIEHSLEESVRVLRSDREAHEYMQRKAANLGPHLEQAERQELEGKVAELARQVAESEAVYSEIYRARFDLIGAEPKIDRRYDKSRIKGHRRGYGDVFREELNEKAGKAAIVLYGLIQKAWKYQRGYLKFLISSTKRQLAGANANDVQRLQALLAEQEDKLARGRGELEGPIVGNEMNREVLQIMAKMGLKYDRSKNLPKLGDLQKVINKNLSTFSG